MKTGRDRSAAPNDAGLKRVGLAGIAVGALALLACEIPIVLAVLGLGLGVLGAGATDLGPPPMVETAAIIIAVMGSFLLMIAMARRRLRQCNTELR